MINVLSASLRQIRGDAEGAVPSPDGSKVAFRSGGGIFVIDANGENARSILKLEISSLFGKLQWSPDSGSIAVLVQPINRGESSIDAIELAGGSRTSLAKLQQIKTFVWLSDGRIAAVTQARAPANRTILHLIDTSGNDKQSELGAEMSVADMSITADGKQIALVRSSEQTDVYVAGSQSNAEPKRLTLDDRDDIPSGWLHDSTTVLFESDRNGSRDVFYQAVDEQSAQLLIGGADSQFGAQASPEGERVLYWSASPGVEKWRLMSVHLKGGDSKLLFEAQEGSRFSCPAARSATRQCAIADFSGGKMQLARFDVTSGTRSEAQSLPLSSKPEVWAVSSDASTIAYVAEETVRVWSAGKQWSLPATALPGKVVSLAFDPKDASQLHATVQQTRDKYVYLLRSAGARRIFTSKLHLDSALPSPDGKRVAFSVLNSSSNVWLVEKF